MSKPYNCFPIKLIILPKITREKSIILCLVFYIRVVHNSYLIAIDRKTVSQLSTMDKLRSSKRCGAKGVYRQMSCQGIARHSAVLYRLLTQTIEAPKKRSVKSDKHIYIQNGNPDFSNKKNLRKTPFPELKEKNTFFFLELYQFSGKR